VSLKTSNFALPPLHPPLIILSLSYPVNPASSRRLSILLGVSSPSFLANTRVPLSSFFLRHSLQFLLVSAVKVLNYTGLKFGRPCDSTLRDGILPATISARKLIIVTFARRRIKLPFSAIILRCETSCRDAMNEMSLIIIITIFYFQEICKNI